MLQRRNLYRQAFFCIDANFSGTLSLKELDQFGKFMLGQKWNPRAAEEFLSLYDTSKDGELDFDEFVAFCETCVLNENGGDDIEHAQRMVTGYLAFKDRQAKALELRWKSRALAVDYFARWTIPLGFFLSLARLFEIDMVHFKEMNADPDLQLNQYFFGLLPLGVALGLGLVIYGVWYILKLQNPSNQLQNQCSVCLDIQTHEKMEETIQKKAATEGIALTI